MKKCVPNAGKIGTTVIVAVFAAGPAASTATVAAALDASANVRTMKIRKPDRNRIRQVLLDSHSTLWGRAFDLSQPDSLEAAIDFVQEILEQLERTDSIETSTQALPPPSPDDCYSYTPNPTSWYSPVCSCSWCRNVLRTANGYLGEAPAKQSSVDRLPGL